MMDKLEGQNEIKIQSTVYPEDRPNFNQWARDLHVSVLYDPPQPTNNLPYSIPTPPPQRKPIYNNIPFAQIWKDLKQLFREIRDELKELFYNHKP